MRAGQVWPQGNDAQEDTTPAGALPVEGPAVAETADVADFRPARTPPLESVPPASQPSLFASVGEEERSRVPHVTLSIPRLVQEAALVDALRWPELLAGPTGVNVRGADESQSDPVYQWQSGLVLALVMLGGLVAHPGDRAGTGRGASWRGSGR